MSYAVEVGGARDFSIAEVRAISQASFQTWLDVTCGGVAPGFDIRLLDEPSLCREARYNSDDGNSNTIVFVTDWDVREHDPAAYAQTTVWHNRTNGVIYDVDMEINEMRGTFGVCPRAGCADRTIDLQNVLTHEVGHFFGMGHTTEMTATMYAVSPPGEVTKRILRTDDISGFCAIYPPGSLPDACDHTPRGGLELTCGGGGCGCHVPGRTHAQNPWLAALTALSLLGLVTLRRRRHRACKQACK